MDQLALMNSVHGVIKYDTNQFVFSARWFRNETSSYICQLQQGLFKYYNIQSSSIGFMLLYCFMNYKELDLATVTVKVTGRLY